jgi:hypothetical protein
LAAALAALLGLTAVQARALAEEEATSLRCPECGLQMTCPPGQEGQPFRCPHCIHKGTLMVQVSATGSGVLDRLKNLSPFPLIVIGGTTALAVALVILRSRKAADPPEPTPEAEGKAELQEWYAGMRRRGRRRQ